MKHFRRIMALALSLSMVFSATVFAVEDEPADIEPVVEEATVEEATVEEIPVEEVIEEITSGEIESYSLDESAVESDTIDAEQDIEELRPNETSRRTAIANLQAYVNVPYDGNDENTLAIRQAAIDVINGQPVKYTQANQVAALVQLGYSSQTLNGPITITKGTLRYRDWFWWKTKDVYLVSCSGTDTNVQNQTTDWWTDLLVGFEQDNQYARNIKGAILASIPAGSNIIVTGHSLGGMVAQQISADKEIKNSYNVLNTVTFGSPLIDGFEREGMVKRLGDTSDIVPYASVSTLYNVVWQAAGLNREDGGYSVWDLNFSAHRFSYQRASVWGAYDPCGEKNTGRELTLDFSTTRFFKSPVTVTE